MGDRGHIGITQRVSETPIYFYTHWSGYQVCELLAQGLDKADKAGRLSDETYATRIIFDALTGCVGEETGYGIMIGEPAGDNQYPIPMVVWYDYGDPRIHLGNDSFTASEFITQFLPEKISK
jgi:hypothetical protein